MILKCSFIEADTPFEKAKHFTIFRPQENDASSDLIKIQPYKPTKFSLYRILQCLFVKRGHLGRYGDVPRRAFLNYFLDFLEEDFNLYVYHGCNGNAK